MATNLGGVLVAAAVLSAAWELLGRRAFMREMLAAVNLREEVAVSGLSKLSREYLKDVEWDRLIRGATKMDIVVSYAGTWRGTHYEALEHLVAKKNSQLRVFLPDPDHRPTVETIAAGFGMTYEGLQPKIAEAVKEFSQLGNNSTGTVEIYVRKNYFVFSCYRLDDTAIIAFNSHQQKRHKVPTLVVDRGAVWDFVSEEIESIKDQSNLVKPFQAKPTGGTQQSGPLTSPLGTTNQAGAASSPATKTVGGGK
ncbi:hypothetical protein FE634_02325 [Nocardioides dongxiaopingii]|uniref:hypothetical protein n=1 Tax=Nocardioides sp. S-1144 TaxID=2582905 RepID=UPI00110F279F|nr:hypothetical protein [Nocardioides sp. S-1144]QCW49540.1 hypothetical protein FE634_02325 [Nocardioides sp. S-1144]